MGYKIEDKVILTSNNKVYKIQNINSELGLYLNNIGWTCASLVSPAIKESIKEDVISTPSHYNSTSITALQVIDDWNLDFYLGNVVKYIKRHELKGNALQDLKKAAQYLQLYIDKVTNGEESKTAD